MCAQFIIRAELMRLIQLLKAQTVVQGDVDLRVVPGTEAPVALLENGKVVLKSMRFGLIPSWSKDPKVKFATHNARLTTFDERAGREVAIFEKPTWRDAFRARHCVVPLTRFIEPIYSGGMAGNRVAFVPEGTEFLWAAGIWERWLSALTGEIVESFAILTDAPIPFVQETGHDRSPVFLQESELGAWLGSQGRAPQLLLQEILALRHNPSLRAEVDRPLAAGWEKRAKQKPAPVR